MQIIAPILALAAVVAAQQGTFSPCKNGEYFFPNGPVTIQCKTKTTVPSGFKLVNQAYTTFKNCAGGCINSTTTACCTAQFNTGTNKCAWLVAGSSGCGGGGAGQDNNGFEVALNGNQEG